MPATTVKILQTIQQRTCNDDASAISDSCVDYNTRKIQKFELNTCYLLLLLVVVQAQKTIL
jgi:hypothetical protein